MVLDVAVTGPKLLLRDGGGKERVKDWDRV